MAPPSGNVSRPGRVLAVLAALVVALLLGAVGSDITHPAKWHQDMGVKLGLDLTSGTTVALRAVAPKGHQVTGAEMTQAIQIMISRVNGAGFTEAKVEQQGSDIINVSVPGKSAQQVINLVRQTAELQFRQVLLLAPNKAASGGNPSASPPASPPPSPSPSASPSSAKQGSASPSPSASGNAAGAPGTGAGAIREMAAAHPAAGAASPSPSASPSASGSASPTASGAASPSASPTASAPAGSHLSTWKDPTTQGDPTKVSAQAKNRFNELDCSKKNWQQAVGYTNQQYNNAKTQVVSCDSSGNKFVLDKAKVIGTMVSSASATPNQNSTSWQVNLSFNGAGTKAFGDLTTAMYNQYGKSNSVLDYLAVVLDGKVVSYPAINQGPILGGRAQITGSFTEKQASDLANVLSYGRLPLSFHVGSAKSVSPQLGRDQLNAGLVAAAIGLGLVVLYLLFYYRGLALVAVCSLVIAGVLSYLSVVLLGQHAGFALSLAGIAGLIVAIGITADSFVVYFERLRDEVRDGRSLRPAVERGWTRARRTILVSDTVSFLAAALLYYFAIGDVKGFAFTLGLTTIIDVVVVFTFTKPMMTLLAGTKFYGGGHPLSGLDPGRLGARAPWRGTRRPARASARTTPAKEA